MNNLKWLEKWYLSQCDEDWEHMFGVTVYTLDNPGWTIKIDLEDTDLENKVFSYLRIERSEHDWVLCKVRENKFIGSGGPLNLDEVISVFRKWAEEQSD
ncbi:immunity 53 family protein [Marininema halotolerans]|uniref:Immunity protein 53 n=1 Tax=Marininema halotolerans TaxID=1155944 RepID=A0A1I6Q032_9BACL|nr:immunity 53 family protein [Marininema halotolerans]SFS45688.1 Immunity protein 53 [Marininema halotolerans]